MSLDTVIVEQMIPVAADFITATRYRDDLRRQVTEADVDRLRLGTKTINLLADAVGTDHVDLMALAPLTSDQMTVTVKRVGGNWMVLGTITLDVMPDLRHILFVVDLVDDDKHCHIATNNISLVHSALEAFA